MLHTHHRVGASMLMPSGGNGFWLALEAINKAEAPAERFEQRYYTVPNCTGSAVCFLRLWARIRPKSRLRCAKLLKLQRSRSRFR